MNIAFVRIPKNASRSIKQTNLFICDDHNTILDMKDKHDFETSFCVCRNPYSRLVSAYTNGRRQFCKRKWPYFIQFKRYIDFESFVKDRSNLFLFSIVTRMGKDHKPKAHIPHIHFYSQCHWVVVDKCIAVSTYIHLENLENEWKDLLERYKIPFQSLKLINQSKHDQWKSYYTEEIADIVYKIYREDFQMFKYSKDSWRE